MSRQKACAKFKCIRFKCIGKHVEVKEIELQQKKTVLKSEQNPAGNVFNEINF